MNKKVVIAILGILFVVSLTGGILGFLNKDKANNTTKPANNKENIPVIKLSNETIEFVGLKSTLDGYEFTKQNLSMENEDAIAVIDGSIIKVTVYKGTEDEVSTTATGIENPKAVLIALKDDTILTLYVLNGNNDIYRYTYHLIDGKLSEPNKYKYEVENVNSFMIFNNPLANPEHYAPCLVIKTTDGKYITDTLISASDTLSLRTYVDPQPIDETLTETTDEVPETNETTTEETTEEMVEETPTVDETPTEEVTE